MRSVKRTVQFRRDFRRVKRGVHGSHPDETLLEALELLLAVAPLPVRHVDHPMKGRSPRRDGDEVTDRNRSRSFVPVLGFTCESAIRAR